MFATCISRFGGPEVLEYSEVEPPALKSGEVLISVAACSVNPADVKVREGDPHYVESSQLPLIPGRDVSGRIVAKFHDVTEFEINDDVCAVSSRGFEGCYAQFVALPSVSCTRKPVGLSHSIASATSLVGLTAISAIETAGEWQAGSRALIVGAAGAIGSFIVQFALAQSVHVTAVSGPRGLRHLASLGVDQSVEYEFIAQLPGAFDIIVDVAGGILRSNLLPLVRSNGNITCIGGAIDEIKDLRKDVQIYRTKVDRNSLRLARALGLVADGTITAPSLVELHLSEARVAHENLAAGNFDKHVLLPPPA